MMGSVLKNASYKVETDMQSRNKSTDQRDRLVDVCHNRWKLNRKKVTDITSEYCYSLSDENIFNCSATLNVTI